MPRRLTVALAALMAAQSLFGLTLDHHYRDPDWIKATWFGNDWFTLLVAVPLLGISTACAARGSVRGLLLWLGTLAFAAYNYAFYLLGASLNVFFPLYVAAVLLSGITLIVALSRIDVPGMAGTFMPSMRVRLMGIVLLTMGLGLSGVWIGVWGAYAFANRPAPVDPEVFKLVAALDLSLMVPGLISGGVLLWRRRPWGYVVAPVSGILATLYLAVLCVNSAIAITRGLTPWPGELPIWIPLALVSAAAAAGLVVNAGREPRRLCGPEQTSRGGGQLFGRGKFRAGADQFAPPATLTATLADSAKDIGGTARAPQARNPDDPVLERSKEAT